MTEATAPVRAKRRYLLIPMGLMIVLLIGYTIAWFVGARVMNNLVDNFVEQQRDMGRVVTYEARGVRGFPFTLRTVLTDFEWSAPGEWSWNGDTLHIISLPYDVSRLILAPRNDQTIVIAGETYEVAGQGINVSLKSNAYAAQGADVTVTHPGGTVTLNRFTANLDLDEAADQWRLRTALRQVVHRPDDAPLVDVPFANALAAWPNEFPIDADVELLEFAINDGATSTPTIVGIDGEAAIDPAGYPEGQLTFRIRNEKALLDLASAYGQLTEGQRQQADAAIKAFRPADSPDAQVTVSLRDGGVFFLGARIGDAPQLSP